MSQIASQLNSYIEDIKISNSYLEGIEISNSYIEDIKISNSHLEGIEAPSRHQKPELLIEMVRVTVTTKMMMMMIYNSRERQANFDQLVQRMVMVLLIMITIMN